MSELYRFPDLGAGSVAARLKRVERTVQFPKRGIVADTASRFRTVAASQVDRDGIIIAGGTASGTQSKQVRKVVLSGYTGSTPTFTAITPNAPVIAQQLLPIPLGLEFGFNYRPGTKITPINEYVIYKSSVDDPDTATRWKSYAQSEFGRQIVQDTVGEGVAAYYWVTASGPTGESAKSAVQVGTVTALPSSNVMTTYRPTMGPSAAYDNNLDSAERVIALTPLPGDSRTSAQTWSGCPAASGSPTTVTLKIAWNSLIRGDGDVAVNCSVDGGSTWTDITLDGPTLSVSLSSGQDLTQVQVKGLATSGSSAGDTSTLYVYEIWIEVVT